MLGQHPHRGLREVAGVAFMLPWSKSAAGWACQGNKKRRGVLATAALLSKTGSVAEKTVLSGGQQRQRLASRAVPPAFPPLPCYARQLLGSVWWGGLGDAGD